MRKMLLLLSVLLLCSVSVYAVLPPKYLSVPNFQSCFATKNMGSWTAWCMPATKPEGCPDASWQALNSLTGRDRMQSCD
ncbi:MAG: hypothetical protein M1561_03050 [Gammaproteobacteria bacterium]|nr:hypothetical protein [Gammaproteobacteria bacterium]